MLNLILAGDIGGTKINLACFTLERGLTHPLTEATYPTADFADFESILSDFLGARAGEVGAATFGVAGPVEGERVELVNVPWVLDRALLRRHLLTERIGLINDMMAMAYGAMALPEESFAVLNAGEAGVRGNAALIAAGTGLGEALLYWDGQRWRPSPSEGGHADFAPTTPLEIELLRYLMDKFGHVSCERILSGPGLYNIYQFLRDRGHGEEPAWLTERLKREDASAVVSQVALAGESPLCAQALEIFVHVYGAEAGNKALDGLATGGVYIGGGIAPKILPKLREPAFMEGFLGKGRFVELLEKIPVKVMLDAKAPLWGAAYHASLLLKGEA